MQRTPIRKFYEMSHFPGRDSDLWVHTGVLNGTRRGFTNLSVLERGGRLDPALTLAFTQSLNLPLQPQPAS